MINYQLLSVHRKIANDLVKELQYGIKQRDDLYNGRCPICGDSHKNSTIKRFYIYKDVKDTVLKVFCHNCAGTNELTSGVWVSNFVKKVPQFKHLYERYKSELSAANSKDTKFQINTLNNELNSIISKQKIASHINTPKMPYKAVYPVELVPGIYRATEFIELNRTHCVSEMVDRRKLPTDRIYVTDAFKESSSPYFKDNVKNLWNNTPALIIPMFEVVDGIQVLKGWQARFISDNFRFLTLKFEGYTKNFGLEQFDKTKPGWIVEAPLDSLHLNNAIASMDANLMSVNGYIDDKLHTFVYDNQPRNKEVVFALKRCIEAGKKVVVFDKNIMYKDINDCIRGGWSEVELEKYLRNHTYSGDIAMDKWYEWKLI